MGFWTGLGIVFSVLFTPPVLATFDELRHPRKFWTAKNILFFSFWSSVLVMATKSGLRIRLWEYLLLDMETYYEWRTWIALYQDWLRVGLSITTGFIALVLVNLYWYNRQLFCKVVYIIPVFIMQLSMNYFLFRTRDDDGEIMIIEGMDESDKVATSKGKKKGLGMPRSIRIKQQQAIESAQANTKISNGSGVPVAIKNPYGSLGKATKSNIKKK